MADWRHRYERLAFTDHPDGVVLVTLSNPGRLNATDAVMHAELATIFRDLDADPDVRAVVVTGADGAFSAGGDLDWIAQQVGDHDQTMVVMREAGEIVRSLIECDTPVVSAINGVAVGAGLAVALMADISVIDADARFTDGHIRLGVAAGDHAVAIWPLLCGMAKAKYLLMTADFIDGREAERIGLVSKAVTAEEVLPEALRIAATLATGPTQAIRMTKRALNHWLRQALPAFEASLAYEMLNFLGPDAAEGLAALQDKRPPRFQP
ncbi:MAG: enoyl-CoA hydratase/isomerase family protein [Actinomycetota bacterium]|jgi:enoyl-CoA hydratase|nr:enoyl-CoA hydratase/isomerase family protein [Actinomycetota bacterium]MDA3013941.1 enoyl-CoA hydratase/isomerase family protein [Actinomycetota bacterium]MDA3028372.1 enoyl-CoA hydratase/isomerase family protein [Actinomycetota bacterium]